MLDFFGDITITKVTPSQISAYKMHLRSKGQAPASINLQRAFLRHAFKKAIIEWEWLRANPVERVARERVNNARDRWLYPEEEKRLIEACVIHATGKGNVLIPHYWLQEIVVFDLNTGMRQDEALSLKWIDVDLFRKTVTIMKSKNGEKRTLPLNKRAFELLKAKTKTADTTDGYVFASEAGTKILARNVYRGFQGALKRAEITDFRFHDLRHAFATKLVQAGVDIYKVSRLLGHKDIKMTQRYAHHCPESLRDAVMVLDA
jgi:integrase